MDESYRFNKRLVPAEIELCGRQAKVFHLFLGENSPSRFGPERPSDVLDGADPFFPAHDPETAEVVFLRRASVTRLSVPEAEEVEEYAGYTGDADPTRSRVELLLQGGSVANGDLSFVLPEGRRRLQDYLNRPGNCLTLLDGGRAHLVPKSQILEVRLLRAA
jgi:hypothetical protein